MLPITKEFLEALIAYREAVAKLFELRTAFPFLLGDHYYTREKALIKEIEVHKAKLTGDDDLVVTYDVDQYLVKYEKI